MRARACVFWEGRGVEGGQRALGCPVPLARRPLRPALAEPPSLLPSSLPIPLETRSVAAGLVPFPTMLDVAANVSEHCAARDNCFGTLAVRCVLTLAHALVWQRWEEGGGV